MGAPMVYQQLRRWMERELGMRFGKAGAGKLPAATPASSAPPG
jgi:hypothetical protein